MLLYPFVMMDIAGRQRPARPLFGQRGRRRPAGLSLARPDHLLAGAGLCRLARPERRGAATQVARLPRHGVGGRLRRARPARRSSTPAPANGATGASSCTWRRSPSSPAASDAFCIGSEMVGLTTRPARQRRPIPSSRADRPRRRGPDDRRPRHQARLCRRLVGVSQPPAGRRLGRRHLPPRSAVGGRRHRLRRHRQLPAAGRLARRHRPSRLRRDRRPDHRSTTRTT